jgi:hypothetical protein
MSNPSSLVSLAFQTFMKEAPQHAQAWGTMVQGLANASALDKKRRLWHIWQFWPQCAQTVALLFMCRPLSN